MFHCLKYDRSLKSSLILYIFIYDGEKSITNLVYGICQEFINKIKQKVFIESPFTTHDFTHFHFMLEKILENDSMHVFWLNNTVNNRSFNLIEKAN